MCSSFITKEIEEFMQLSFKNLYGTYQVYVTDLPFGSECTQIGPLEDYRNDDI